MQAICQTGGEPSPRHLQMSLRPQCQRKRLRHLPGIPEAQHLGDRSFLRQRPASTRFSKLAPLSRGGLSSHLQRFRPLYSTHNHRANIQRQGHHLYLKKKQKVGLPPVNLRHSHTIQFTDLIDTQSQGAWLLKPEIQRRFEDLTIRVKFRDADLLYGGEFVGMAGETCPASNRRTVVLKPGQVAINAALNRTVPVSVRYLERFPGMAPGTAVVIDGEHCGLVVLVVDDRADGKSMVQDEDGNEHVVESTHLCVAVYPKTGPGPRKTITRKKQPPAPRACRKRKSAARN